MSKATLTVEMIDALSTCYALDNAAYALTLCDILDWAAWVHYFLESLQQNGTNREGYEDFLQSLQHDIAIRLEQGQW